MANKPMQTGGRFSAAADQQGVRWTDHVGDPAKSVTRALAEAIGRSLRRIIIRAFDGEVSNRGEFADP